jgi:hypothetical protein
MDPASELRERFPMNQKAIEATIKEMDARGLAFQIWLTETFMSLVWGDFVTVLSVAWCLLNVAVVAVVWQLNVGTQFETRQLIAGTVQARPRHSSLLPPQTNKRPWLGLRLRLRPLPPGPLDDWLRKKHAIGGPNVQYRTHDDYARRFPVGWIAEYPFLCLTSTKTAWGW